MGSKLANIWKFLWRLIPAILLAISIWAIVTIPFEDLIKNDSAWMYCLGWGIVTACLLIVIIAAIYEVYVQVDYNFIQVIYRN